jgi:hypothetical protein
MRLTPRRYDAPRRARRALFFRFCRPKKPKTRAVPGRDCRKKSRISPLRLPPQLARPRHRGRPLRSSTLAAGLSRPSAAPPASAARGGGIAIDLDELAWSKILDPRRVERKHTRASVLVMFWEASRSRLRQSQLRCGLGAVAKAASRRRSGLGQIPSAKDALLTLAVLVLTGF